MQLPKRIITLVLAGILVLTPLPVAAHEIGDGGSHHQTRDEKRAEVRENATEKRQEVRQKLDDKKRQICAKREATINKRTQHIVDMRGQQINHIGQIVERTKKFYADSGRQLVNYDALVATVDAKRQAADAALVATRAKTEFKCDGEAPKAHLQEFKTARDSLVAAIRDYRQAAKDLIVGVKSAKPLANQENQ